MWTYPLPLKTLDYKFLFIELITLYFIKNDGNIFNDKLTKARIIASRLHKAKAKESFTTMSSFYLHLFFFIRVKN